MAITAGISVSPYELVKVGTSTTATVTITNSATGGPAVPILGLRPIAYVPPPGELAAHTSVAFGEAWPAAGAVPAAGSLTFTFGVTPHAPGAYKIGAEVLVGDGTTLRVTIEPPYLLTVTAL